MKYIDLRSDTVTLPTQKMREAMAAAELGDDVFQEDPTVNRLQEVAAKRLGKEAGLLVASGTQGNLVSLMAQTKPGEEVIVELLSHIYNNESAGLTRIAGLVPRLIQGKYGVFTGTQVAEVLRPRDVHFPRTSLVCLENTHNAAGGTVVTPSQMEDVGRTAREHGIRLHLDGARIFNAAVALDIHPASLAGQADSVTFCLSKGLACPVGSVVVGSEDFIEEARRARKVLGGGMRQAGVIAAAGLVALEKMVDRLEEDHANARLIAEGVASIEGLGIDMKSVQTNIVIFDVAPLGLTSQKMIGLLKEEGLLAITKGRTLVRCVTHYGIEREHAEEAVRILEDAAAQVRRRRLNP